MLLKNKMNEISINTTIDQIVIENKIFRFASELQYTEDDGRKYLLREILRRLQNDNSDKSSKAREEINKISEKLNENQMKKKWFRLSNEHKIEQIKRYFEKKIDDVEKRNIEMEKVLKLLESDSLKNKDVTYNEKEGKIENIDYDKVKKEKSKKKVKEEKKDKKNDNDSNTSESD
jgi:hypothetical protein